MAQQMYSFMIDPELEDGLHRLKARDGIVEGEQIRLALRDWLDRSGISGKAVRGDERPLPKPFRWLAIGFNVMLLYTEAVLLMRWGVTPQEVPLVSFLVATPLLNLAVLLDYHRRGL